MFTKIKNNIRYNSKLSFDLTGRDFKTIIEYLESYGPVRHLQNLPNYGSDKYVNLSGEEVYDFVKLIPCPSPCINKIINRLRYYRFMEYILTGEDVKCIIESLENLCMEPGPTPPALRFYFSDLSGFSFDYTDPLAWTGMFTSYSTPVESLIITNLGGEWSIVMYGMSDVELGPSIFSGNKDKVLRMEDDALSVIKIDRTFKNASNFNICIADACEWISDFSGSKLVDATFPSCIYAASSSFQNVLSLENASFATLPTISTFLFSGCENLQNISFPLSTVIGGYAFYGCINIVDATIDTAVIIYEFAFGFCTGLVTASFTSATDIGAGAFYSCNSMIDISIPQALTVGSYAFRLCTLLLKIAIPLATDIGDACFSECFVLNSLNITSCTNLGASAGYDWIFYPISGNTIFVSANVFLLTNNGGAMDGDLQDLDTNNTVIFTWV